MQSRCAISAFLMLAILFSATTKSAEAQQTPSCASSLGSCAGDLNTTTTPATACCTAITQVLSTQLTCLCNLYNSPGLLTGLGINTTQARDLPRRCGIPGDADVCAAPAPGATNPGHSPGGNNGSGNSGSGVGKWSAMPVLLLLWAVNYLY